MTRAGRWTSFSPGSCVGVERNAATNQVSSKHIVNCFQHIPGSCGALHNPCGGAPQQRGPLTPQTETRPNRLNTHTHPPERLAHPRSPIPPLSTLTSRATHAHPTSPRSTGFCAIWGCVSSSSSSSPVTSHVRSSHTAAAAGATFTTHANSLPSRLLPATRRTLNAS